MVQDCWTWHWKAHQRARGGNQLIERGVTVKNPVTEVRDLLQEDEHVFSNKLLKQKEFLRVSYQRQQLRITEIFQRLILYVKQRYAKIDPYRQLLSNLQTPFVTSTPRPTRNQRKSSLMFQLFLRIIMV